MSKRSKTAQLAKTNRQKQKVSTGGRGYFFMRNLMLSLIYYILQFLCLFGGSLGQIGVKKGQKLPIVLKITQNAAYLYLYLIFF